MQEFLKEMLTIAKEGTTLSDVEERVKKAWPGLQDAVVAGLKKDGLPDLVKKSEALRSFVDAERDRAVDQALQNERAKLPTLIEQKAKDLASLSTIEGIKKRLESEQDPNTRELLELKLEVAEQRKRDAERDKEAQELRSQADRAKLRGMVGEKLGGAIPSEASSLLDLLVGADEETTSKNMQTLLKALEHSKSATFDEFARKHGIKPDDGPKNEPTSRTYSRSALRDPAKRKEYTDRLRKGEPVRIVNDQES